MYRVETETGRIRFYYKRDVLFNDVSLMSNFMAKNLTTKDGDSLTDDFAISDDEKDMFGVCLQQTLPDIYESMAKITNGIDSAFEACQRGVVGVKSSAIAVDEHFPQGVLDPETGLYIGAYYKAYDTDPDYSKVLFYDQDGKAKYRDESPISSSTAYDGTYDYYSFDEEYVTFILQNNDAYNSNVLSLVDASLLNAIKIGTLKEFYSVVIQPEFFKVCTDRFIAELYKLKQRLFQFKKKTIVSNLT